MEKVCPSCGARSSEKPFIGNFCEECYAERVRLEVPRVVEILRCKKCGRMRSGAEWVPMTYENVSSFVGRKVKGEYSNVRFQFSKGFQGEARALFLFERDGRFFEVERRFEVKFKDVVCEECLRRVSGYYEAVVQVRGSGADFERLVRRLKRALESKTFVSKEVRRKEGVDLYVGSWRDALATLEEMGLRYVSSSKLYGVKDGRRVYRMTYCIRL